MDQKRSFALMVALLGMGLSIILIICATLAPVMVGDLTNSAENTRNMIMNFSGALLFACTVFAGIVIVSKDDETTGTVNMGTSDKVTVQIRD